MYVQVCGTQYYSVVHILVLFLIVFILKNFKHISLYVCLCFSVVWWYYMLRHVCMYCYSFVSPCFTRFSDSLHTTIATVVARWSTAWFNKTATKVDLFDSDSYFAKVLSWIFCVIFLSTKSSKSSAARCGCLASSEASFKQQLGRICKPWLFICCHVVINYFIFYYLCYFLFLVARVYRFMVNV